MAKSADFESLNRLHGETPRAYQAFLDYIQMGTGRSLRALHAQYVSVDGKQPPTRTWDTIQDWSRLNKWQERLADYLQELTQHQAIKQRERLEGFNERLWNDYEKLAGHIEDMLDTFENQRITRRTRVADPTDPTGVRQMEVVRMKVNVRDLRDLVNTFGQLGKDLRTQLGLPNHVDVTSKGDKVKGVIGFDPAEWDNVPPEVPKEESEGKDDTIE